MTAILTSILGRVVEYLAADDFANARKLAHSAWGISNDHKAGVTTEEIAKQRLTALMAGIAAERSQAATGAAARKKRNP